MGFRVGVGVGVRVRVRFGLGLRRLGGESHQTVELRPRTGKGWGQGQG